MVVPQFVLSFIFQLKFMLTNCFSPAEHSIQNLCKITNSTTRATSNFFAISHVEPDCSIVLFTCKQSQFTLFESNVECVLWLVCYSNLRVLKEENCARLKAASLTQKRRGVSKGHTLPYLVPCDQWRRHGGTGGFFPPKAQKSAKIVKEKWHKIS